MMKTEVPHTLLTISDIRTSQIHSLNLTVTDSQTGQTKRSISMHTKISVLSAEANGMTMLSVMRKILPLKKRLQAILPKRTVLSQSILTTVQTAAVLIYGTKKAEYLAKNYWLISKINLTWWTDILLPITADIKLNSQTMTEIYIILKTASILLYWVKSRNRSIPDHIQQ